MVAYGAVVWWLRCTIGVSCRALRRIQRLACLGISGALRTTPTAALEVLLNLAPLATHVVGEAMAACYRLVRSGQWKAKGLYGHALIKQRMSERIPCMALRSDFMVRRFIFNRRFVVKVLDRGNWEAEHVAALAPRNLVCYTDGSRFAESAGSGLWIPELGTAVSEPLGLFATVFQAEIWAILGCAMLLLEQRCRGRCIYICSDSQAALKALASPRVGSQLVLECIAALKRLAGPNSVKLIWVPGHRGVEGNERADSLAKEGAEVPFVGPEPVLGVSSSSCRTGLRSWISREQGAAWRDTLGCRQAKEFIPGANRKAGKVLLGLPRCQLRLVVGVLTGHCGLNYHLWKMGLTQDPLCDLCAQGDETSRHFLCECDGLAAVRHSIFGSGYPSPGDIASATISKLLELIRVSGRLGA
ncbi:MAG: hypothetical protein GY696_08530 [Gammaproteobacteria bacterium]|nr:hypothetical protein [Gammaproteobacteria bacterium]